MILGTPDDHQHHSTRRLVWQDVKIAVQHNQLEQIRTSIRKQLKTNPRDHHYRFLNGASGRRSFLNIRFFAILGKILCIYPPQHPKTGKKEIMLAAQHAGGSERQHVYHYEVGKIFHGLFLSLLSVTQKFL